MVKKAIQADQVDDATAEDGPEGEIEMFGEKEARWYQIASRNQAIQALQDGFRRILIVQATGLGKTLTAGLLMGAEQLGEILVPKPKKGKKREKLTIVFIAHRHRLLTQAERTFAEELDVNLVYHSAFTDLPDDLYGAHVAVLDEAHHEAMMTLQYQLERLGRIPIIGLTATPDRADGSLIKFEVIINPISRAQAVEEGYLAETDLWSFVDVPNKNKAPIIKDMIDRYGKEMGRTMVFVQTKAEVADITAHLKKKKWRAVGLTTQTDVELDRILDHFSEGKIDFIINCLRINEGVDVKGCESVILGRQFGSYPQLNQVIGRASRPDSDCRVWELINPLSGRNLDTTVVVGTPRTHKLVWRHNDKWVEREFDYTSDLDPFMATNRDAFVGKTHRARVGPEAAAQFAR